MDRMSISFSKPQSAYLRAEANRLGISVADLIRRMYGELYAAAWMDKQCAMPQPDQAEFEPSRASS